MRKATTCLLAASVLLTGCAPFAETPMVTNFPNEKQRKMQAAFHWQLIARDTATRLIAQMPERKPLHVRERARPSPFERAFNQQLVASLLEAGYPVMKSDAHYGTLIVEVAATPVPFSPNRLQNRSTAKLTMLSSGLWVLERIYDKVSPGAAMVSAAAAVDAHQWLRSEFASGPTPRTELIVTSSISNNERFLAQTTAAYYTSESDALLYLQAAPYTLPLKGGNR